MLISRKWEAPIGGAEPEQAPDFAHVRPTEAGEQARTAHARKGDDAGHGQHLARHHDGAGITATGPAEARQAEPAIDEQGVERHLQHQSRTAPPPSPAGVQDIESHR